MRNSWGEYWGELGYFRLALGDNDLGIESMCSWATVDTYSDNNFACYEDGSNCGSATQKVIDPADNMEALQARLLRK